VGYQPGLGERVRRARLSAGLTQEQLADGTAISASYLSLIESGRREPKLAVVAEVAARLGLTPEHVLTGRTEQAAESERYDLALARLALADGQFADALGLLQGLLEQLPEEGGRWPVLLELARAQEMSGDLHAAVLVLEDLRVQADREPERLPWLPVVVSLSRCYREAGDSSRAVELASQALERCEELGLRHLDGYVQLVSTLSAAHAERGDLLRASILLEQALAQPEQADGPQRAYLYWNAGLTASERGQAAEGLRLVERAAALLGDQEDDRSTARLEVSRAWVLLAQQPPDAAAARALLAHALPRLERHAGALSVASAHTELARAEALLGNVDAARRHAQQSLDLLSPVHKLERAKALAALGSALVAGGESASGLLELALSADLLREAQSPRQAATVFRQLADAYVAAGQLQEALTVMEEALNCAGVVQEPVLPDPATVHVGPAAGRRTGSAGPSGSAAAPGAASADLGLPSR